MEKSEVSILYLDMFRTFASLLFYIGGDDTIPVTLE